MGKLYLDTVVWTARLGHSRLAITLRQIRRESYIRMD